jgi:D-glycero-alpha-D-manno-heptose-7-phosphate kinase
LPARTGLGSSSSFTVGFLNALYALEGKIVSPKQLAEEATYIEQELIKENVGCQDQIHAAYGGMNKIEFDKLGISVNPVVITKEKYDCLNESLMIFYTGLTRYASEIVQEQTENTRSCNLDSYLRKMRQMVYEAEKIISDRSPVDMVKCLGKLLDEGWELKKCLSSRITNKIIDDSYRSAKEAGAYGGKLAGAGGGGFMFLLVPKEKQPAVRKSLNLMEVSFKFEKEGSKIIYFTG